MELPNGIKDVVTTNIDNLIFILCGKDGNYTGPLADGFQKNDWISICVLCSSWLYSLGTMVLLPGTLPSELASIVINIIENLIKSDKIQLPEEEKTLALQILNLTEHIIVMRIIKNLEKIDILKKTLFCCFGNSAKKIQDVISSQAGKIIAQREKLQ